MAEVTGSILAVVTLHANRVTGGVPIFIAADEEELQKKAFYLSRVLDCSIHDLEGGILILVRH